MKNTFNQCSKVRLLLAVLIFSAPAAASEVPTHWFRVANPFTVQPTPVNVNGQAGPHPVADALMLAPLPGRTMDSHPIAEGAIQAAIPAHSIYIYPFVPQAMGGFVVNGLLPVSGAFIEIEFPAMLVDLPRPVPEGHDTMAVCLDRRLNLKTTIHPFTLPILYPPHGIGTVNSFMHGPVELPLVPVISLTLDIRGQDPVYHYGILDYALSSQSRAKNKTPWSWRIGGWWEVEIWDWSEKPDVALLTHHRRYNSVGGSLESASEPTVPDLGILAVTAAGPSTRPNYKIQFAKMKGGGSHTLVFVTTRPQGPPKTEQPFPGVAMIALGQWMNKMGGPDLKVDAPLVPQDQATTWKVKVDENREMTLSWCME